ncbi:MAG TPA: septal ring lytic transglycosylase RlpA family protein [Thermoanaerobaculia bacterium]|nr:septal ring lytic transglycosylase RlpA family protein [Thermoanaerobaculia bacterium]
MARLRTDRFRLAVLAGSSFLLLVALLVGCSGHRRPADAPRVVETGTASWYGGKFHGRLTANGERYDMHGMTAAHKTLPFGTVLEVRNLDNGKVCRVRVNDRGPFVRGRIVDVSYAAAQTLGMIGPGTARVELAVVPAGPAAPVLVAVSGGGACSLEAMTGSFTVQVGAFSESARAATLRDLLRSRFPDAEVRSDGRWHRVQVGAFDERGAAESLRAELERLGWAALVVVIR